MDTSDHALWTMIEQQLATRREELVAQLRAALEATLFSHRATIRPAHLRRIAAAEAEAFLAFLKDKDAAAAHDQGAQRAKEGLGEPGVLRLGTILRQFCLTHLDGDRLPAGLAAAEAYSSAFLEGFMAAREAIVLDEQERIRSALQRALGRYTIQLQTAAEVAQAASSILDLNELLRTAVDLIRERFDLYYAGIFLVDEYGEWAVLRAGTGEPGQEMLRRGHKLRVGGESMIGWCAAHGQPRIALDVGREAVRFDNPLLPETRSEMALPLISRGQVMGAMTIQSSRVAAFSEEDITILQTLAGQLANAIENARLFAEAHARAEEAEAAHRRYLREEWATFLAGEKARRPVGYAYEQATATTFPIPDVRRPELDQAAQRGTVVVLTALGGPTAAGADTPLPPPRAALAAPLTLRGEVIGALSLYEVEQERTWSEDDIALVEAVAAQVAVAVENARLFQETQAALAETEALYAASRAITAARSREEIVAALVEHVGRTWLDRVVVALVIGAVEGQPVVEVQGVWDRAGQEQPGRRFTVDMIPLLAELGPQDVMWVNDLATAREIDETTRAVFQYLGVQSAAALPISTGQRVLGWLLLETTAAPHEFTEKEIRPYVTLAGQAGVALESQQLLAETERRARRERLIHEVTAKVWASPDLDGVLKTTAQELSQALGTSHAVVRLGPPSS